MTNNAALALRAKLATGQEDWQLAYEIDKPVRALLAVLMLPGGGKTKTYAGRIGDDINENNIRNR